MESWSLGVLIGLPVVVVALIIVVTFTVYTIIIGSDTFYSVVAGGLGVFIILMALWVYYPYSTQYHKWVQHTGTVDDVSSRILGSSDSVEQKFVVIIDGQEYGCNDTRCSLIEKGDTVTLSCIRVWQYAGTDGYDCNFVRRQPAA